MRFILGICLSLLLSGVQAGAAELSDLRAARSLAAEAALLFRLDAQHRLTKPYVTQTRQIIRDQLQSELQTIGPASQEGQLVRAALSALQARDPGRLDQAQQQLTHLVDEREQAH